MTNGPLKNNEERRVGARGLQHFPENRQCCRPAALSRRFFNGLLSVAHQKRDPCRRT
jgi:hypothetical protein